MLQVASKHGAARQAVKAGHSAHGLHWLMGFGTLGLFAVSTIDSSIIPLPLPGSTDLLLILLVVHRADPVLAAIAALAGSILGGYLTWGAGAKGGEAALHRYLPKRFARRLTGWVEKNGTLAVTTSALLPPPFPLMPFVLAAGALGVSRKKFFLSFGLARAVRYSLVAWLAATLWQGHGPRLSPLPGRLEHHPHVGVFGLDGGRHFVRSVEISPGEKAGGSATGRCAQREVKQPSVKFSIRQCLQSRRLPA